ncbi:hypothetical protein [Alicyclobacillus kakegawensis]|uniref:hypothetical protein n=1 Tax=Alicyclobacillus kakegawensis TaxID=392012 RepID=UPI00082DBD55|nr:hypothetical protein [Alicyclobacillus kakegawensis]
MNALQRRACAWDALRPALALAKGGDARTWPAWGQAVDSPVDNLCILWIGVPVDGVNNWHQANVGGPYACG